MPKRPRGANQLAKLIVDITTREADDAASESKWHLPGHRIGGLKGGKARAEKLTPEERQKIAQKAANARWRK